MKDTINRHVQRGHNTLKKHAEIAKHKTQPVWNWIRHHAKILTWVGASVAVFLLAFFIIWIATLKVPTLDSFADRKISSSTKLYDRTGEIVLYDVYENVKRTAVTSDQISPLIKQAVVAIEDKDFYSHHGIQISSILRAGFSQVLPFVKNSGGSTITQQLVKNTLLTQKKSLSRKVKEWVLAVKVERIMTKDQILTNYLNEAPYGGTIYGVEEASEAFYGKHASEVTLAQAAYLAAIPNLPSFYSPYGKNRQNLNARKNLVLKSMLNQGMISESEYDSARAEEVTFRPREDGYGKAIHFVEYIREYLEEKYGRDAVLSEGLKVTTTLDWYLQQAAEKTIHDNALKNEAAWNASNSALVALDPKTGQILSMVGSRDYFDKTIDGMYNVATASRQPGSAFKPIVYARAFEKSFQPETVVFDIPTQFGPCPALDMSDESPCYAPNNYDNAFLGPISLRNALAQSRNVPAVQLLAMVGLPDALATAKKLGLTTLDRNADRYGLTMVLGGGEVSLLDLTSVYGVFANDGVRNQPTGILKVEDSAGNVLEEFNPQPETVMNYNAVRKLSSVLSDNAARTPLLGANSFMYFGSRPVAAKTGTTSDNKDAWVVGYTPDIAVGVWSGNNDNTPMKKGSAISGPAWRAFMDAALQKLPYEHPGSISSFGTPERDANYYELAPVMRGAWAGGESFWVDTISGKLATDLTPPETRKEYVIPNVHSILYWIDRDSSQFNRWETEVLNWVQTHPGIVPPHPQKPTQYDDVHTNATKPDITINNPGPTTHIDADSQLTVTVSVQSHYAIKSIDYYLDDRYIGSGTNPGAFTFIPSDVGAMTGINTLRVVVTDVVYNQGEAVQDFTVE